MLVNKIVLEGNVKYAFDDTEGVCVSLQFMVEDAGLVQRVDLNVSGGVDDLFVAANDAGVNDVSVLVCEEGDVTNLGFLYEVNRFS